MAFLLYLWCLPTFVHMTAFSGKTHFITVTSVSTRIPSLSTNPCCLPNLHNMLQGSHKHSATDSLSPRRPRPARLLRQVVCSTFDLLSVSALCLRASNMTAFQRERLIGRCRADAEKVNHPAPQLHQHKHKQPKENSSMEACA